MSPATVALSTKLKLKRQLEYEEPDFQDVSGMSRLLTGTTVGSTALGASWAGVGAESRCPGWLEALLPP